MLSRVLWTVGIGLALVAGLYGITAWSGGPGSTGGGSSPTGGGGGTAPAGGGAGSPGGSAVGSGSAAGGSSSGAAGETAGAESAPGGGSSANLTEGTRQRVDSLQTAIDRAASGEEARRLREELVRVFTHAGRYDRAGEVQEAVAEQLETAEAWARSGNFYYDWMMKVSGSAQTQYARRAISAYQRSLELDPDDLDVRTDMAVAYLYDPDNPMEAIKQTNQVLDQDPDHVQANFNKGIMLMQIGRTGQAADQFRKVMEITPDTGRVHRRAQQALQRAESP